MLSSIYYLTGFAFLAQFAQANVIAAVSVPSSCTLQLTNSVVAFPATTPGGNAPLANAVSSTNNGNIQGYIWLYGTNWIGSNVAINFLVSNTIFSNAINKNAAGYFSNSLSLGNSNTAILLPAVATNTLYFGVNIPSGQVPNTYTQNIIFQSVC